MKTVVLNIGTKRDNKVSDSKSTIGFEDIDYKLAKLLDVFGGSTLVSVKVVPAEGDWGREWTVVAKIKMPHHRTHIGGDYAEIACSIFEQEAVSFKMWNEIEHSDFRTLFDSGLAYNINWCAPKHGEKYDFDDAYFIDDLDA